MLVQAFNCLHTNCEKKKKAFLAEIILIDGKCDLINTYQTVANFGFLNRIIH